MFSGSNSSEMDLNAQLSFCFYSVSPQQYFFIYLKPKILLLVIDWLLLKAWKFSQTFIIGGLKNSDFVFPEMTLPIFQGKQTRLFN